MILKLELRKFRRTGFTPEDHQRFVGSRGGGSKVFSVLMQKLNKSFLNTYTFIKIFLYNPRKLVTLS